LHEGEEKKMRRLFIAIFMLLLLIDLGDDGFIGKARFVSPGAPSAASVASSPYYGVEQVDSWRELPLKDLLGIFKHYQNQKLTCNVRQILKKISFCRTSGSGGLPL
jgi:hypothetical protein